MFYFGFASSFSLLTKIPPIGFGGAAFMHLLLLQLGIHRHQSAILISNAIAGAVFSLCFYDQTKQMSVTRRIVGIVLLLLFPTFWDYWWGCVLILLYNLVVFDKGVCMYKIPIECFLYMCQFYTTWLNLSLITMLSTLFLMGSWKIQSMDIAKFFHLHGHSNKPL